LVDLYALNSFLLVDTNSSYFLQTNDNGYTYSFAAVWVTKSGVYERNSLRRQLVRIHEKGSPIKMNTKLIRTYNRLNFNMDPNHAAAILALRPAIENLVSKVAENPDTIFPLQDLDRQLVDVVIRLSHIDYERVSDNEERNQGGAGGGQYGHFQRDSSFYGQQDQSYYEDSLADESLPYQDGSFNESDNSFTSEPEYVVIKLSHVNLIIFRRAGLFWNRSRGVKRTMVDEDDDSPSPPKQPFCKYPNH